MAPFPRKSVLLILFTLFSLSAPRDTITPTRPLADNETLVSAGGTFALGFFTPSNSERRYIGAWYNKDTTKTIVWVANREDPVIRSTGQLSVTANGTVIITNGESTVVWSVGSKIGLISPVIELLDTANFVLKEEDDNTENYAWQGFDYPTDTLLPGMKLGVDKKAGLNRTLTAWKGDEDPSPGEYTAVMDTNNHSEMYLFARSRKVWRSGPWDGRVLGCIAFVYLYEGFYYRFVNDNKEVAFSYQVSGQSIAPILKVSQTGNIQWLDWMEETSQWGIYWKALANQCDNIGECGPYAICDSTRWSSRSTVCNCLQGFIPNNTKNWDLGDHSEGCVRELELDCQNGTDGFLDVNGVKLPESFSSLVNTTIGCRFECLKICSCTAYAIIGGGGGCVIWGTKLLDMVQLVDIQPDVYIRLSATSLASHLQYWQTQREKRRMLPIIVSLLIGTLLLSCVVFFLWRIKKKTRGTTTSTLLLSCVAFFLGRRKKRTRETMNFFSDDLDEDNRGKGVDLPLFNFDAMVVATESFSAQNKLGQGGFGPVYKGKLCNNREIAVKRLARNSQQGAEEFKNEVMLIAKLQNRNLVRLLGCCIQGEERMLVYEYMPNKSLDTFLFVKEKAELLDCATRYQIIMGITRGLLYLHHDSRYRIIHRDLKASNILLDKEMNPKISDFGMARLFGEETDHITRKIVGTYGYMSPEYAMEGTFSLKSDVFSFGVLLLEVVSGKKNRGAYAFSPHLNLVSHTWTLWNEGEVLEVVDESMAKIYPINEVLKCIKIGLLCVQEHPEDRPLMSSVIVMLGADIVSLPQPKKPGFIGRMSPSDSDPSPNQQLSSASNGLTITFDGR